MRQKYFLAPKSASSPDCVPRNFFIRARQKHTMVVKRHSYVDYWWLKNWCNKVTVVYQFLSSLAIRTIYCHRLLSSFYWEGRKNLLLAFRRRTFYMLIAYIKHLTFCTDIIAVDWRHVIDMPFGSHKPSGSKDTQTVEPESQYISTCWFPASMYSMGKLQWCANPNRDWDLNRDLGVYWEWFDKFWDWFGMRDWDLIWFGIFWGFDSKRGIRQPNLSQLWVFPFSVFFSQAWYSRYLHA